MSLPEDKLSSLRQALAAWGQRHECMERELLSLIGSLAFAAKVVPPGRTFTRRLIDLSTTGKHLNTVLHLTPTSPGGRPICRHGMGAHLFPTSHGPGPPILSCSLMRQEQLAMVRFFKTNGSTAVGPLSSQNFR